MTPEEFAAEHGLTLEEAAIILHRRQVKADPGSRAERARSILALAQKRVGVHPVAVDGDSLSVVHDPDADVGKSEFYGKKVPRGPKPEAIWERTWDEFDQSRKDSE